MAKAIKCDLCHNFTTNGRSVDRNMFTDITSSSIEDICDDCYNILRENIRNAVESIRFKKENVIVDAYVDDFDSRVKYIHFYVNHTDTHCKYRYYEAMMDFGLCQFLEVTRSIPNDNDISYVTAEPICPGSLHISSKEYIIGINVCEIDQSKVNI